MKTEIKLTLEHFSEHNDEGVKATFQGKHCSSLERLIFISKCYEVLDEMVEKTLDFTETPEEIRDFISTAIKSGEFDKLASILKHNINE